VTTFTPLCFLQPETTLSSPLPAQHPPLTQSSITGLGFCGYGSPSSLSDSLQLTRLHSYGLWIPRGQTACLGPLSVPTPEVDF
jgi:hypothetical protein